MYGMFSESETTVGVEMKILAFFLLAVLGFSLAEGKHLSKCKLRDHLKNVTCNPQVMTQMKHVNMDELVAKIACNTEVATGFNTCAVKEMTTGNQGGPQGPNQHHPRGKRSHMGASMQNSPSPQSCRLYGVFQLPNHLACDDGVTPSSNICRMPCSKLHDDNILDDISCMLKTASTLGDHFIGAKTWENQGGVMKPIMEKKCENIQPSAYFAGC